MRFDKKVDLEAEKVTRQNAIDEQAEAIRSLFITVTTSQALVYAEKRREAEALQADPELSAAATPHLTAEAALNGVTREQTAAIVLAQALSGSQISAAIETKRLAAKAAVRAAATAYAMRLASEVDWSDIQGLAVG